MHILYSAHLYFLVIIEDADPNASDSEFMDPVPVDEIMGSEEESTKDQANDDDLFAQELEKALQGDSEEDDDDDDDDDEDEDGLEGADEGDEDDDDEDDESVSGSGTDEDEDDEEYSGAKKVLDDEIKQLETAINKKNQDIAAVQHVALKVPFFLRHNYQGTDLCSVEPLYQCRTEDASRFADKTGATGAITCRSSRTERAGCCYRRWSPRRRGRRRRRALRRADGRLMKKFLYYFAPFCTPAGDHVQLRPLGGLVEHHNDTTHIRYEL